MRTEATAKDKLPDGDIRCFLKCHIPYRLEFLRRGIALAADSGVRDPAVVEAALMAGRQLIEFLGIGLERKGPRTLKAKLCYQSFEGRCYEVKVVNLGGEFHDTKTLDTKEQTILAEFIYAAEKSSAHLTEDSKHKLWDDDGEVFYGGCKIITRLVRAACSIAESRLAL
jgi:hypothetical protein